MEYPRMMYHKDGRSQAVRSEAEESDLGSDWSRDVSAAHRRPSASPDAVLPVHQSGGDDLVERVIARMREEFFPDAVASTEPARRGPGRPRNASADRGATRNVEPKDQ